MSEAVVLNGGGYWDRTSGPCRVKRGYGACRSTICECSSQLQQALGITWCHLMSRDVTNELSQNCPSPGREVANGPPEIPNSKGDVQNASRVSFTAAFR